MATNDLETLRRLVGAPDARNENACAKVLKAFASVLIPQGRSRIYEAGSEVHTRRGRCDLVVLADEYVDDQESKRVAYVWELKAPQCCMFLRDGGNRARPSDDLYSAENQLIHYLKSLRSDREWQTEHGILAEHDIKFGGIVIGRQGSLAMTEEGKRGVRLARRAKEIRDELFYAGRILLWDWDHVLWSIEHLAHSSQALEGVMGGSSLQDAGLVTEPAAAANQSLKLTVGRRRPPAA